MKSVNRWITFLLTLLLWMSAWTMIDTLIDIYKLSNNVILLICAIVWWLTKEARHECYMGCCVPNSHRYNSIEN